MRHPWTGTPSQPVSVFKMRVELFSGLALAGKQNSSLFLAIFAAAAPVRASRLLLALAAASSRRSGNRTARPHAGK
jgi:hypothetical protein